MRIYLWLACTVRLRAWEVKLTRQPHSTRTHLGALLTALHNHRCQSGMLCRFWLCAYLTLLKASLAHHSIFRTTPGGWHRGECAWVVVPRAQPLV